MTIENWSGAAFLDDSLQKTSGKGLSPFKKGDIDSFRLYLSTADSKDKERWLYLLYKNALYGVDDPEECIELIIKQTLEEESLGLVIKGLNNLNSIIGYERMSYRNISFANLIRDRNRFRTILKKHPEAINEMFRLFSNLHDSLFKDLAIKKLKKYDYSNVAYGALEYLIALPNISIEDVALIDKLTCILLSMPPDSFYRAYIKPKGKEIGDTMSVRYRDDSYRNWLLDLFGFFIVYGEPGIPYMMKYLTFDISNSIKDDIVIYLGILEEKIHKPNKSPELLVQILAMSNDNRTLFIAMQLCSSMKITAAIPYLKHFLEQGQKYTEWEMYQQQKYDLADRAAASLEIFGYKIVRPKKRPGFYKIIYEPPEYKNLK
jgi:hypothetical protein